MKQKLEWNDYFMNIATVVASKSSCCSRQVGAILVKDKRIVSTGYNGTPKGIPNCNEGGCPRCNNKTSSGSNLGLCLCSHAEENAIIQAAYHGVSIKDSVLYSTLSPCLICCKMIINAGVVSVYYRDEYKLNDVVTGLFNLAHISIQKI